MGQLPSIAHSRRSFDTSRIQELTTQDGDLLLLLQAGHGLHRHRHPRYHLRGHRIHHWLRTGRGRGRASHPALPLGGCLVWPPALGNTGEEARSSVGLPHHTSFSTDHLSRGFHTLVHGLYRNTSFLPVFTINGVHHQHRCYPPSGLGNHPRVLHLPVGRGVQLLPPAEGGRLVVGSSHLQGLKSRPSHVTTRRLNTT